MNISLTALAPMLVALVVVVALAIDVMWRLSRLQQRHTDAQRQFRPTRGPRRAQLALVPPADTLWLHDEPGQPQDEPDGADTRPQRRRA